jgi:hypothetical protein
MSARLLTFKRKPITTPEPSAADPGAVGTARVARLIVRITDLSEQNPKVFAHIEYIVNRMTGGNGRPA